MKTIYKHKTSVPYSLHDMRISRMELLNNNLKLHFENGYVELKKLYSQVDGTIIIESLDPDFCHVYLLSKNGRLGVFHGEKLELKDFLKKYPDFSYEVIDELYGYNMVRYSGYLTLPEVENLIEMDISLYYEGNIIYETI